MKHFGSRQFALFLLTGGIAALVNFISRIVYGYWLDFSSSIVIAYLTGMITAFVLARRFVFVKSDQALAKSITVFVLVNLVAIVQTWGISLVLANQLLPYLGLKRYVAELAHAVGIAAPVFTSFLGHKYFTFR
jgi:putative flippase GtrA